MSNEVETPVLVDSFTNERFGICANVREVPGSEEHELLVVDAISGDVVITRILPNREEAEKAAKLLTNSD